MLPYYFALIIFILGKVRPGFPWLLDSWLLLIIIVNLLENASMHFTRNPNSGMSYSNSFCRYWLEDSKFTITKVNIITLLCTFPETTLEHFLFWLLYLFFQLLFLTSLPKLYAASWRTFLAFFQNPSWNWIRYKNKIELYIWETAGIFYQKLIPYSGLVTVEL